jgi:hypothetical protein
MFASQQLDMWAGHGPKTVRARRIKGARSAVRAQHAQKEKAGPLAADRPF